MAKTHRKNVDPALKAFKRESTKRYQKLVNSFSGFDYEDTDEDSTGFDSYRKDSDEDSESRS